MNRKDCDCIAYILAQMVHDGAPEATVTECLLPQFENLDLRIRQDFEDYNKIYKGEEERAKQKEAFFEKEIGMDWPLFGKETIERIEKKWANNGMNGDLESAA